MRTYEHQVGGQTRHGEEFIATKLGHDTARTSYIVERTRRTATIDQTPAADTPTNDTPDRVPPPSARNNPAVAL